MGIDYRIVNGYVYISGNPVTDPEKIAERADVLPAPRGPLLRALGRALRGAGKTKMEALIDEITDLHVPDLPEYEPDEVMERDDKNTRYVEVLDAYQRTLRCGDLMWQHHFEFLLLGYGAYLTFAELCKAAPARHPRPAHRADGRRASTCSSSGPTPSSAAWPGWRSRPGSTARSSRGARRTEIEAELGRSDERPRLARGARADRRTPGSTWRPATASTTTTRSWYDDPSIPYASMIGYVAALKAGERGRAPDRGDRARARPARRGVRRAARRGDAQDVRRPAQPVAHGLPVRRGAQVLLRLLVPDALVEQGARVRRAARAATASSRTPRTCSSSAGTRSRGARRAAAHVGDRRRRRSGRATGRRSSPGGGAARASSASGRRRRRSARRPRRSPTRSSIMLWGVTTQRVQEWARAEEGGSELTGAAAVARHGRRAGPRRDHGRPDRRRARRRRSSSARSPLRPGRRSSRR